MAKAIQALNHDSLQKVVSLWLTEFICLCEKKDFLFDANKSLFKCVLTHMRYIRYTYMRFDNSYNDDLPMFCMLVR